MGHIRNSLYERWQRLERRLGRRRLHWLAILGLIGACALSVRVLLTMNLENSALLYLLVPYSAALLITGLRPAIKNDAEHWGRDVALTSLVVLLGSSIVLGEGFICVLFFLPFYFIALGLVAATRAVRRANRRAKNNYHLSLVPVLVLALSLEGTVPALTVERYNQVERLAIVDATPGRILANLERPIQLDQPRHWLLSIFPMPEVLSGQQLVPGARHRVHLHYPRWWVTNVQSGTLELEILQAGSGGVVSQVRSDTTLFSNYLNLRRMQIHLDPLDETRTKVTLAVAYDRKLDPAWYFQPLMRFAVARMADHLLKEVIARD